MRKSTRNFVVWIALVIILLSSVLFVMAEANHACAGAHCHICAQLHCCENLMKCLALSTAVLCLAAASFPCFASSLSARSMMQSFGTLISHKIKLSI